MGPFITINAAANSAKLSQPSSPQRNRVKLQAKSPSLLRQHGLMEVTQPLQSGRPTALTVHFNVLMEWVIGTSSTYSEPSGQNYWYELKGKKKIGSQL